MGSILLRNLLPIFCSKHGFTIQKIVKVQRIQIPNSEKITWLVLGNDYLPIEPIREFLTYLRNLERSPNTIRSYAYHLKLYWQYLEESKIDWKEINIAELADKARIEQLREQTEKNKKVSPKQKPSDALKKAWQQRSSEIEKMF